MSKHTPGEWEVYNGYLIRAVNGTTATPIAKSEPTYRPMVGPVRASQEEFHNMRLMAAAPDLLQALMGYLECAHEVSKSGNVDVYRITITADRIENALEAVKKALGRPFSSVDYEQKLRNV